MKEKLAMTRESTCLTDGSPVTDDHREINPATGMQKGYVVLTEDERAKGFVRPVRSRYQHVGSPEHDGCNHVTTMGRAIAETYARDPGFYSGTFCCYCGKHFPLDEFVWADTDIRVGT